MRSSDSRNLGVIYRLLYKGWRRLPDSVREAFHRVSILKSLKISVRDAAASFAGRDDVYNSDYYDLVDTMARRSVDAMAESIVRDFRPIRVVDVGCGTGALLDALRKKGVDGHGYEYSKAALEVCSRRGLSVTKFDITKNEVGDSTKCDVVTSTEVAEHIEERFAERLVGFLTALGPVVVFTAAVPGQGGGTDHVNEQPHEYWIRKFGDCGFQFLADHSDKWREEWRIAGAEGCYWRNLMIFESSGR